MFLAFGGRMRTDEESHIISNARYFRVRLPIPLFHINRPKTSKNRFKCVLTESEVYINQNYYLYALLKI